MEYLLAYLSTIALSKGMSYLHYGTLVRDLAYNKQLVDTRLLKRDFNDNDNKISKAITYIPVINMLYSFSNSFTYLLHKDEIIGNYIDLGYTREMNNEDYEDFMKNPSIRNAMSVNKKQDEVDLITAKFAKGIEDNFDKNIKINKMVLSDENNNLEEYQYTEEELEMIKKYKNFLQNNREDLIRSIYYNDEKALERVNRKIRFFMPGVDGIEIKYDEEEKVKKKVKK